MEQADLWRVSFLPTSKNHGVKRNNLNRKGREKGSIVSVFAPCTSMPEKATAKEKNNYPTPSGRLPKASSPHRFLLASSRRSREARRKRTRFWNERIEKRNRMQLTPFNSLVCCQRRKCMNNSVHHNQIKYANNCYDLSVSSTWNFYLSCPMKYLMAKFIG